MSRRTLWAGIVACVVCSSMALAQRASPQQPSPTHFESWRNSRIGVYMNDFGELARYRDENARLVPPTHGERRIVFFGDSITDNWPLAEYFPGKPYLNRGISGQTTAQMLVRFRQDVIALQPQVVVILAGTNDIAGNTGPMRLEDIEANYASLAELAKSNRIGIVFSSVLPVHNYTPQSLDFFAQRSPEKIVALNRWLQSYCTLHGYVYLDYFSAMIDKSGLLKEELANDGLHPNKAGYRLMAPMAEVAIGKLVGVAK
jgi:lysophospholipase L1-like esterase